MKQLRTCWHVRAGPASALVSPHHASSALVRHRVSPRVKPHQAPRASRPYVYTAGTRSGRKARTVRAVLAGDAKKCARQGTLRAGKCTRRSRAAPRVYTVGNVLRRRTGKAGGLTPRMHAAGNLLARKVCTAFLSLDVTAFVRTPCRPPSSLTQKPRFLREDDGRAHQLPRRRAQHHRQRV